jgi:uncharacterized membrane protein YgdD (TMEM256/DUF423 family)
MEQAVTNTLASRIAALLGLLAVALGAFGAHGLKHVLEQNHTAALWEKAVLFQFIHAVMLFILAGHSPRLTGPWCSLLAGIVLFSGSLYLYALTKIGWLSAFTPFGGVSFIIGWLWLVVAPVAGRRVSGKF